MKTSKKNGIEIIHGKGQNGLFYCNIKTIAYPYTNALAYGKSPEEAEKNAWQLRKMILEHQFKTISTPIVVDTSL